MSIEISCGYFSLIVNFEYINFAKPKGGAPVKYIGVGDVIFNI